MTSIRDVLANNLGVKELVVGSDFRFGKDRSGDVSMLIDQGPNRFIPTIIPEVSFKNMKMSSSSLRNMAKNGDFSSRKYATSYIKIDRACLSRK